MKYREALIAWTPGHKVEVGPWPDVTGWSKLYSHTAGACFAAVRDGAPNTQRLAMMAEFATIVMRDGIPPRTVHGEFLKIDEYRAISGERVERAC